LSRRSRRRCLENVKRVKTQLENQFEGGRGVDGDIGVDTIQSPKAKAKWFGLRKNKKRYGFGMPQPVRVLQSETGIK